MQIAVGADHRALDAREAVVHLIWNLGHETKTFSAKGGRTGDYPEITARVASAVCRGEVEQGILLGHFEQGMCIVANKFPNVRAVSCADELSAEMARRYLDANVLCLSTELLGERLLDRIVRAWLQAPFDGGRHSRRLRKLEAIEREVLGRSGETSALPPAAAEV